MAAVLSMLGYAAIVCDSGQGICAVTPAALPLLGGALALQNRRLASARPTDRQRIDEALKAAAAGEPPIALDLPQAGRPTLRLTVRRPPLPAHSDFFLLMLAEALAEEGERATFLRARYGLTVSELEIIEALASGEVARDIAVRRGTSQETVRGQVKSALRKTASRRQSDLIRLFHGLR